MEFITRSTKIRCIVASAITAVALITLIMLSCLLNITNASKTLMCFIYTSSLLMVMIFWHGLIQINVFTEYKSQKKHLCADGVISICLSSLLTISAMLFGFLQARKAMEIGFITGSSTDIRLFLLSFLVIMSLWKLYVLIISMKEKRFNRWVDLAITLLWFGLSTLMLSSLFLVSQSLVTLSWIFMSLSWALIAVTIVQTLYTYVFRNPDYLSTDRAIQLKEKADQAYEEKQKRLDLGFTTTDNLLQDKLNKLKQLVDSGYITKQEFYKRRKELLDREL